MDILIVKAMKLLRAAIALRIAIIGKNTAKCSDKRRGVERECVSSKIASAQQRDSAIAALHLAHNNKCNRLENKRDKVCEKIDAKVTKNQENLDMLSRL